jgi:hypothetical protein
MFATVKCFVTRLLNKEMVLDLMKGLCSNLTMFVPPLLPVHRRRLLMTLATAVFGAIFFIHSFPFSQPHRKAGAFYFWKTRWDPSLNLLKRLESDQVDKLYMRFFDVAWDKTLQSPQPLGSLKFVNQVPPSIDVIPVVYITNEVFQNSSLSESDRLAGQVWSKVAEMAKLAKVPYQQLQIDCDWSDSSKQKFFEFAAQLRNQAKTHHVSISATIRLHQIKYFGRTGIPPVDRGMLMFYNMGSLEAEAQKSSIFDAKEALKYLAALPNYPLPLDLALPVFSWRVHSRQSRILGLDKEITKEDLTNSSFFTADASGRTFKALQSFFLHGRYIKTGDVLFLDDVTPKVTAQAAALAANALGSRVHFSTVAFFDLDERVLEKYDQHVLENILQRFD